MLQGIFVQLIVIWLIKTSFFL